jgi:hypothetical protein
MRTFRVAQVNQKRIDMHKLTDADLDQFLATVTNASANPVVPGNGRLV